MDTVDIENVSVLRTGRWNGREYSSQDLQNMVEAFNELKGIYSPPGKLGHNPGQTLLSRDGLPAAGWVKSLRVQGEQLIADFARVPAKFASLIKAGAYRHRSAEVWFDMKFEGKVYPRVLKAVAWLGADPPAVDSLSDVVALYTSAGELQAEQVESLAMSCVDCPSNCTECGPDCECHMAPSEEYSTVGPGQAIALPGEFGDADIEDIRSVLARTVDRISSAGANKKGIRVVRDLLGETQTRLADMNLSHEDEEPTEETLDDATIREILGLKEDEDIKTALLGLKVSSVELTEYEKLSKEVDELRQANLTRDATDAVERGIADGKIAPKMRDWAVEYYTKDVEGFQTFLESAPKIVDTSARGSSAEDPSGAEGEEVVQAELTKEEQEIAAKMGTDVAKLRETKTAVLAGAQSN